MAENTKILNWLLGFLGGTIGGVIGYYAFFFMTRQGLYPMVLPGALIGLGCGGFSGMKSKALGIISGLCALVLGVVIEWQFAPFAQDRSFGFFLTHLNQLRTMTLVLIVIGALLGFAFGMGREGGVWLRRSGDKDISA